MRRCIWAVSKLPMNHLVPPVARVPCPELIPPNPPDRSVLDLMDPLAPSIPVSPGIDASVDMDVALSNDYYWWTAAECDELDDASDDMLFGWIKQSKALFPLANAGYRFTVSIETTILPLPQPSWRERRKLCRQSTKPPLPHPETPLSTACLPPPSPVALTTQFLRSFNPAESARPLIPRLLLPRTLVLGVDLTKLCARPSIACILLNYVFNINFANEPIIVNTGASVCITPHADDFTPGSYRPSTMQVKDRLRKSEG